MQLGTALIVIFCIGGIVAMLHTAVGRGILGIAALLGIAGLTFIMRDEKVKQADYAATGAEERRICGTNYQFAIHDPTTESCWTAFTAANVNSYATNQCGGEYNYPHKKGYEACVARFYLTVCGRDNVSYITPGHCAALGARMAQYQEQG